VSDLRVTRTARRSAARQSTRAAAQRSLYRRRPRRPPLRRELSVGMGVTSSMRPILSPLRDSARSADCAPGPGVFVLLPPVARSLMCSAVMPSSCSGNGASASARRAARVRSDASTARATRLALQGNVLGGKHSGVGRGLVAVGLHLHAACKSKARHARASDVRSGAQHTRGFRGVRGRAPAAWWPRWCVPGTSQAGSALCAARAWKAGQARALVLDRRTHRSRGRASPCPTGQ